MRPAGQGNHFFLIYIYLQTAALMALVWFLSRDFYHDDAYISLRYAQNLVDGKGMAWNPGERVEGYTNFLFILLAAALGTLGTDLVLAGKLVSFAGFFGVLCVLWRYIGRDGATALQRAFTVSLAASSVPMLAWCMGGLEGNLFAFFLCGGICLALQLLQHKPTGKIAVACGLFFALATLTRPEGLMLFLFTGAFLLAARIPTAALLRMLGVYAFIVIPYMVWRYQYFGEFLPNTYYAKTYGIDASLRFAAGAFYLLQYVLMPPLLLLFCAGMLGLLSIKRRVNPAIAYLTLFLGLYMAYIASVGGDHMSYFRFMLPAVPPFTLLIYHCGKQLLAMGKERWWHDIMGALLFFSVLQVGLVQDKGLSAGALSGLAVSDYVSSHWPKDSTIALNPAGALAYTAPDYRYIDMLGLLDKTVARRKIHELRADGQRAMGHLKGDGGYVLSRRPDYIIFGLNWGDERPLFLSDLEITESTDFRKYYVKKEVYITPPAHLLSALQEAARQNTRGLVLDQKNRLRFLYYQRKTE